MEKMKIQDFILEDTVDKESVATTAKKVAPKVAFNILVQNHCDFVVERKTTRTKQILAVIPSKGSYYIKKDDNTPVKLTSDNLRKFLVGMSEPLELSEVLWLPELRDSSVFARELVELVNSPKIELAKKGYLITNNNNNLYYDMENLYKWYHNHQNVCEYTIKTIAETYNITVNQAVKKMTEDKWLVPLLYYNTSISVIESYFSADNAKTLIKKIIETGANFSVSEFTLFRLFRVVDQEVDEAAKLCHNPRMYNYMDHKKILEILKMAKPKFKFDSFCEYLIFSSCRQGYINDIEHFVSTWTDTLSLQKDVYEKITNKYPDFLESEHFKLVSKSRIMKQIIDDRKIKELYDINKDLEWREKEYSILVPQSASQIVDEAVSQANCLRTYISRIANGDTRVVFLRKNTDIDSSLVTIEVCLNGRINQVKAKYNREPNLKEKRVVARWAEEKELEWGWRE